jgi:CheY-like chemotaxis protein
MQRRARVLVIGEHPAVRRLVSLGLSQLPIDVQDTSPSKAHEYLDRGPPQVVVLDLHAPMEQALSVCSRMPRDLRATPILTVLLLPGGDDRLRALARATGATACLDKPFRICQLQETVRLVLVTSLQTAHCSGGLGTDLAGAHPVRRLLRATY